MVRRVSSACRRRQRASCASSSGRGVPYTPCAIGGAPGPASHAPDLVAVSSGVSMETAYAGTARLAAWRRLVVALVVCHAMF